MSSNPLAPAEHLETGLVGWIHAAKMSSEAYRPATWRHKMLQAGWAEAGYVSDRFSFGAGWAYSGPELGILEISCAGTKGLRDFSSDALSWIPNRWKRLRPGWWVGYGMVRGPRAAWADLMWPHQSTTTRPVDEIRWWGHSKGAAEAQLCHAACRCAGLVSSCIAIESPRIFKPFARDQYRLLLKRDKCGCDIIINTVDGRRDFVTAWPRTLKHGGDLNVLGKSGVYSGDDALDIWRAIKLLEQKSGHPPLKGRYDAHGLAGVTNHMEELLEIQRSVAT